MQDVFDTRDAILDEYERFSRSFTHIRAPDIRQLVDGAYNPHRDGVEPRYWPEPLIQVNPHYRRSHSVADLVAAGELHPACADVFRGEKSARDATLMLYRHQVQSIGLARMGKFLKPEEDQPAPVTFGIYTGKESDTRRDRILAEPPDILLTDFMMLRCS